MYVILHPFSFLKATYEFFLFLLILLLLLLLHLVVVPPPLPVVCQEGPLAEAGQRSALAEPES